MQVSSAYIRILIRKLMASAGSASAFCAALEAIAVEGVDAVNKGRVLVGTASSGTSVQFALPPIGSYTAEDVLWGCDRILSKAEALVAATPAISVADLKAALLATQWGTSRVHYALGAPS